MFGRFALIFAMLTSALLCAAHANAGLARETGPYFLCDNRVVEDRWLIERFTVPPVRHPSNPLVTRDKPWEGTGPHSGGAVLYDEQERKFLMWYSVWNAHAYYNRLPFSYNVCYAESRDGIRWKKPSLGVFEYEGSKRNNIIKLGQDKTQNIDVCWNPKPDIYPGRFLAVHNQKGGLFISYSDDGKTFTFLQETPAISYHSDTHNNFEYDADRDRWLLFCRPRAYAGYHKRRVSLCTSADLKTWTHDRTILVPGETDWPEFYGMVVFQRGGLFWGLLQCFDKQTGFMHPELAWSADGEVWQQLPTHPPFAERGPAGSWDAGMVMLQSPVFFGDEVRFYYGGFPLSHDTEEENIAAIGLMTSQRDRFIGLRPTGSEPGSILTRPFDPAGRSLVVNARIRGSIRAELRTDNGKPVEGYTLNDCDPIAGDAFEIPVTWRGQKLGDCSERTVRILFQLSDADLFAFDLK